MTGQLSNSATQKLIRPQAWPTILAEYLEACRELEFAWGEHDCCMFAANWVYACCNYDPSEEWAGAYESEQGALKILKENGGVQGLCKQVFPAVPLNFARRGDLVTYLDPDLKGPAWSRSAVGILTGATAVFLLRDGGYREVSRDELHKTAWKVGE